MARKKEFAPDKLVEKAMHLFWQKGYFDTSMSDLVEATGVQRYGIYSTFKNKHNLFLETLKLYQLAVKKGSLYLLTEPDAGMPEIIKTIYQTADSLAQNREVGCYINKTAAELAAVDPEAKAQVLAYINMVKELLRSALENAKEAGDIPADESVESLTNYLLGIFASLPNLTQLSDSDSLVKDYLDGALAKIR